MDTKQEAPAANLSAAPYEPTEVEVVALAKREARRPAGVKMMQVKVQEEPGDNGGVVKLCYIHSDHPDPKIGNRLVEESLGTRDPDFANLIIAQLANLAQTTGNATALDGNKFRANLAMVQGIAPMDELEAMLAAQMAAVHSETMAAARRMQVSSNANAQEMHERTFTRLTRTFVAQIEALKKYRSGGPQRVIVEHKHYHLAPGAIAPGSQAILGDVSRGGGGGGGGGATRKEWSIPCAEFSRTRDSAEQRPSDPANDVGDRR